MDLKNCSKCGKIFIYSTKPICEQCAAEEEAEFSSIKQYILDNPGAHVADVAEQTKVSVNRILRYLKEGRLEISPDSSIELKCEKCGKSIRTGRFCESCRHKLSKGFADAIAPESVEDKQAKEDMSGKMHTYKRKR